MIILKSETNRDRAGSEKGERGRKKKKKKKNMSGAEGEEEGGERRKEEGERRKEQKGAQMRTHLPATSFPHGGKKRRMASDGREATERKKGKKGWGKGEKGGERVRIRAL